ncbi:MAG: response regulator [Anaerolineae bacterium]|nr:response regulator [Anaerolineae bacterium]
MAGEHILIVDDSKEILNFLLAVLAPLGYQITTSEDGKDGLARIVYEKPELVLLDLNLPGMSGISILESLHQKHIEVPIIMMTFHGSEVISERALRLGAREYIVKPFQIEDMLAAIERVLGEVDGMRAHDRLLAEIDKNATPPPPLKPQTEPLVTFEEMMPALASAPSQEAFLSQITQAILAMTGADASAIFLPVSGKLAIKAVRNKLHFRSNAQLHDAQAETVFNTKQPTQIFGTAASAGFAAPLGQPVRTSFYVPIKLPQRVLGVLGIAYLQRSDSPGEDDENPHDLEARNWLNMTATYAAVVLENAHLHESLHKAIPVHRVTDMLTMLLGYASGPLQKLWKILTVAQTGGEVPDLSGVLSREIKRVAILLSIFREIATPKGPLFIATTPPQAVEEELKKRLATVPD